ncbi:MerR family DNA-binding transcriptional regulator [Candidatus Roizmanbacteria bacterium CG_4_9_14_0_2_um_filter_36_12]|uniref:MerR family DNA-binding transcriptional regulator n=1 Tax=Candidatus Roizmanbacteria bacterium CG_4_9_14_0_2_um_filter_36_12 TaxID=1974837 RepID=A0A2M8F0D5_9BACT|nr:MAG: MerR family DNA-binding transcriptional regulator [Candidatus Roizmanbacteria bacterium CG_4_9_14_0_2_um_filter_36_12]
MANRKLTLEEVKQREFIKMSELAELNGVRYSTVKYYTELGLLPFEQQGKRLAKKYNREVASKRLKEILKLKGKGKTIPDIINYFISNS